MTDSNPNNAWDEEYDVVVVGSGNGALTAAIRAHDGGAKVLVIEKNPQFGGTSASSGGGVWVPNNRYAKAAGVDDSPEEARQYLQATAPEGKINPELLETYAQTAPEMIDYLHENTNWVRYLNLPHYPDYFPEAPGGKTGNRSMEPEPLHGKEMGEDFKRLAPQHPGTQMPGGINFTQVEGQVMLAALPGWMQLGMKLVFQYLFDIPARLKGRRDARLTMGNAGVARLFMACKDRGIEVRTESPMRDLIDSGDRIEGVVAEYQGKTLRIRASKGVVLAAGGFERNQAMREKYLPHPTRTEWSAGSLGNTGDAIQAAMNAGAATHQMDWGWWFTTAVIPGEPRAFMSQVEKGMPGCITVNKAGKRFSNESQNYVSFVTDVIDETAAGNECVPCYMIFDADFRHDRPIAAALIQSSLMPDWAVPKKWWTPEFLTKANSLRELAEKVGIDADGLEATQKQFNEYAKTGKDLDFQRGDSDYDRYYADPNVKPNPCLGPLLKPPFYAVALYPGEMGTAGGLVVDTDARVLREDKTPIEGLYACGNTTSALLPKYPGPGSTLGPAMTFGYLAAKHITAG